MMSFSLYIIALSLSLSQSTPDGDRVGPDNPVQNNKTFIYNDFLIVRGWGQKKKTEIKKGGATKRGIFEQSIEKNRYGI